MVRQVTIIGFGAMGSGIAEYLAMKGYNASIFEVSREIYDNSFLNVRKSLSKLSEKGTISESPDDVLKRIRYSDTIEGSLKGSGIVIEAVNEDAELKSRIFRKVGENVSEDVLITSNTSSIPISHIQKGAKFPDRIAGLHWFNPPVLMRLVEIVKGSSTSEETISKLSEFVDGIGKERIVARKDVRGFIANRIVRTLRYHSSMLFFNNIYTVNQIDSALMFKFGLPLGIFALTDFTGGLKLEYDESKTYDQIRQDYPDYEPSPGYDKIYRRILKRVSPLVEDNRIGFRSGKGFYDYPSPGKWSRPELTREEGEDVKILDLLAPVYNHALYMVRNRICTIQDIDTALKLGFNWPKGIFEYFGSEVKREETLSTLEKFSELFPDLEEFYAYQGE